MLRLRDIMTKNVVTIGPDTTLAAAIATLAEHHVSGAPVLKGTRVVGVLSASDLLAFEARHPHLGQAAAEELRWEDWSEESEATDESPTAEWFTEPPSEADGDLVEDLGETALPGEDLLSEHVVGEVMTRKLWALGPDESVERAADLMRRRDIHRVLVLEGDELLGLVSSSDIARVAAEGRLGRKTYVFNPTADFRDPWG